MCTRFSVAVKGWKGSPFQASDDIVAQSPQAGLQERSAGSTTRVPGGFDPCGGFPCGWSQAARPPARVPACQRHSGPGTSSSPQAPPSTAARTINQQHCSVGAGPTGVGLHAASQA